jgi:hypothetical protein
MRLFLKDCQAKRTDISCTFWDSGSISSTLKNAASFLEFLKYCACRTWNFTLCQTTSFTRPESGACILYWEVLQHDILFSLKTLTYWSIVHAHSSYPTWFCLPKVDPQAMQSSLTEKSSLWVQLHPCNHIHISACSLLIYWMWSTHSTCTLKTVLVSFYNGTIQRERQL